MTELKPMNETTVIQRFKQPTKVSARDLCEITELAEQIASLNDLPERCVTSSLAHKIREIIQFYETPKWVATYPLGLNEPATE